MSSSASASAPKVRPVVLVSIDGWGLSSSTIGNAIYAASTPNMDRLSSSPYLFARIDASGFAVGLPKGVMGNSEVGHLTMGAGRASFQDLVRINASIEDKSFFSNRTLLETFDHVKRSTGRLHLLGLISDGGVHSHIEQVEALLLAAKQNSIPSTYIHFFADGRDTPPSSGIQYIERVQKYLVAQQYGSLATVIGRYYAMDRDKRWERVQVAWDLLLGGKGEEVRSDDLIDLVTRRYNSGENDEFLKPIVVDKSGVIQDGDTLIFFDFRSDRMREIVSALSSMSSPPFDSPPSVTRSNLHIVQMTQYDEKLVLPTIFPPQTMTNSLTEWLSKHKLLQFHTAETEKYAHVTFFFAGGKEEQVDGEERMMIPSPKVATYDLKPEMSMAAVGDSVVEAMAKGRYAFVLCNLAAPDMVGHTGIYDKAVIACTACDQVIGVIQQGAEKYNYTLIVTADHGNAEEMMDADGKPKTSHTTNLIPILIAPAKDAKEVQFTDEVKQGLVKAEGPVGGLSDVAPTVLAIMGLEIPKEMTGKSLVKPLPALA